MWVYVIRFSGIYGVLRGFKWISLIPGAESLTACGLVKARAAAPIRRLEYSNPAGLEAWMLGCLDAGRIGLDRK